MRVESYESQFKLPRVQREALKRIVQKKTGLDESELRMCTTKKVQAVLNDSELWLMLQVEISNEEHDDPSTKMVQWIAKTIILIKVKGPDIHIESSQKAQDNKGITNLGSKDMEDFIKEVSYNAKRLYGPEDDIEIELKVSAFPSYHMVLFLLIWKKSMVKNDREDTPCN